MTSTLRTDLCKHFSSKIEKYSVEIISLSIHSIHFVDLYIGFGKAISARDKYIELNPLLRGSNQNRKRHKKFYFVLLLDLDVGCLGNVVFLSLTETLPILTDNSWPKMFQLHRSSHVWVNCRHATNFEHFFNRLLSTRHFGFGRVFTWQFQPWHFHQFVWQSHVYMTYV